MSMLPIEPKVYDDGRTKQSFKDETDINRILARAQITGTISHLERDGPRYGDFANFDFHRVQLRLAEGRSMFARLPYQVRLEFDNDPKAFFEFVNDPANEGRLAELLPELARPGRQLPDVDRTSAGGTPPIPTPADPLGGREPADTLVDKVDGQKASDGPQGP